MMETWSRACSRILLKYQVISKEEEEIYIYGFELLFTTVVSVLSMLGISLAAGCFYEGCLFMLAFFVMRVFAGGYHADTHWGCFLITNMAFVIGLSCSILLSRIPRGIGGVVLFLSSWYIWKKAPMTHPNQPLTEVKRIRNQKNIQISICLIILAAALLLFFDSGRGAASLEASTAMVCSMMIIKPKRRTKYVEVT